MPSLAHEVLAVRLRERPELLSMLLSALHLPELPDGLSVDDSVLRLVQPVELRPDLVLAQGDRGPWVLVEIQLDPDPDKKRRWPLAAAMLLDAREVMGDIVVITSARTTAMWAESVAFSRGRMGTTLHLEPVVVLLSEDEAERLLSEEHPELGFFAAFAMHERYGERARVIVSKALQLAGKLPSHLQAAQFWAIFGVLSEPMRAWLEEVAMNPQTMPKDEAFERFWQAIEARERRAEVRGEVQALLKVLDARGLAPDEAARVRIEACTDKTMLEEWLVRAATASTLASVFGES